VYNSFVPGQRSPDQKLIAFPLDEALLDEVESARGAKSRSQFIREALTHYLHHELGVQVREGLQNAPDRAGKKHRPKVNYRDNLKKPTTTKPTKKP
jgi:hypothetical protein